MPHSFGRRARTREKFSKGFRLKGRPSVGRSLISIKKGDYVDIVCDSSEQRGMPYQFYHGRTGLVFNVTKRALGVEVKKVVGNRQIAKRIHVRIEHVRRSRCNEDFLKRRRENDNAVREAAIYSKENNLPRQMLTLKREPKGVTSGFFEFADDVEVLRPLPFIENY